MTDRVIWIVATKCETVTERKKALRSVHKGKDENNKDIWEVEYENMGWFAHFEGSAEAIGLGFEKPDMEKDDEIEITIRVKKRKGVLV